MAGGAQGEKGSAEAWLGASDRTHILVGRHRDGWLQEMRAYLKPKLTSVALRRSRGASCVKKTQDLCGRDGRSPVCQSVVRWRALSVPSRSSCRTPAAEQQPRTAPTSRGVGEGCGMCKRKG